MSLCLIGLGSNEGDRQANVVYALEELGQQRGVRVLRQSRCLETSPIGGPPGQDPFLNAVAVLESALAPEALLAVFLRAEAALGRRRAERWGPRTIDLDLLLYDGLVLSTPTLVVPHPRMAWRRFVLEPAAEVAGSMIHPTTGWTIARLLEHLNTAREYVAIAGPIGAGKTELAQRIAQSAGACWIAESLDPARLGAFYADPAGYAWSVGIEFLNRRAQLLAADASVWRKSTRCWVSDFWFDQGLAFTDVWLPAERRAAFEAQWKEAARGVVRPKLTVMLDAATERLLERIAKCGRPGESRLTGEVLERIREALDGCLRRPDVGPVLRLTDEPPDQILREVLAAVEAMK